MSTETSIGEPLLLWLNKLMVNQTQLSCIDCLDLHVKQMKHVLIFDRSLFLLPNHGVDAVCYVVRHPADNELFVFKLLSKYITEPLTAKKFVDILLPLLAKRLRNSG